VAAPGIGLWRFVAGYKGALRVGVEASRGERDSEAMRKRRSKLLRQFPSFDALSDDEARRFLTCARRSDPLRTAHGVALFLIALLLFTGVGELIVLGTEWLDRRFTAWPQRLHALPSLLWAAWTGAMVLPPAWLVLALRDHLVRCRLRHLLRNRASCPECGYSLDGLPEGRAGVLVCPECGLAYPAQDIVVGNRSTPAP
jgi:integrase